MSRHKTSKFFLGILFVGGLFVLAVLGFLDRPINYGRLVLSKVNTPIYRISIDAKQYVSRWWRLREIEDRLLALEKERLTLITQLVDQTEIARENESLRAALQLKREHKLELIPAQIFARLEEGGLDFLHIDIGAEQLVEQNDAVIDENGVILGKIWQVDRVTAKVLLLTNQKSKIGAEVIGNNNFGGIVEGQYGLGIVLTTIPKDLNIKPNDIVITSGLENSVPRGLKIGEVVEILAEDREPFKKAILRNFIDHKTVYRVF